MMKRFDLRHLKGEFYNRMIEIMDKDASQNEVIIFLFEVGDFSSVQKSADTIKEHGYTLMNSLKFNEVDWTIVVKKASQESLA
jgi:NADH-quinone oxidoreductase subunit E